jgi:hypothetical protein
MAHRLKFAAHSGLGAYEVEEGELAECRLAAAKLLRRRRRQDHPCTTLKIGREWEISEPEDCLMVPDTAGILWLVEIEEPEQDEPDDYWEDDDGDVD